MIGTHKFLFQIGAIKSSKASVKGELQEFLFQIGAIKSLRSEMNRTEIVNYVSIPNWCD